MNRPPKPKRALASNEVSITIENGRCVVASTEAACVAAFYCASSAERVDMYAPFLHFIAAVMRLEKLGQCETKDEVREMLGEALLWSFLMYFVHAQEGNRSIPCKWFKGYAWANRGPDRSLDEWPTIMAGVREKSAKLAAVFARYGATSLDMRRLTSASTFIPGLTSLVNDTAVNGEDLRALCDMFKLSPRECFEAAVMKRESVLEHTHKKLQGKNNQLTT